MAHLPMRAAALNYVGAGDTNIGTDERERARTGADRFVDAHGHPCDTAKSLRGYLRVLTAARRQGWLVSARSRSSVLVRASAFCRMSRSVRFGAERRARGYRVSRTPRTTHKRTTHPKHHPRRRYHRHARSNPLWLVRPKAHMPRCMRRKVVGSRWAPPRPRGARQAHQHAQSWRAAGRRRNGTRGAHNKFIDKDPRRTTNARMLGRQRATTHHNAHVSRTHAARALGGERTSKRALSRCRNVVSEQGWWTPHGAVGRP